MPSAAVPATRSQAGEGRVRERLVPRCGHRGGMHAARPHSLRAAASPAWQRRGPCVNASATSRSLAGRPPTVRGPRNCCAPGSRSRRQRSPVGHPAPPARHGFRRRPARRSGTLRIRKDKTSKRAMRNATSTGSATRSSGWSDSRSRGSALGCSDPNRPRPAAGRSVPRRPRRRGPRPARRPRPRSGSARRAAVRARRGSFAASCAGATGSRGRARAAPRGGSPPRPTSATNGRPPKAAELDGTHGVRTSSSDVVQHPSGSSGRRGPVPSGHRSVPRGDDLPRDVPASASRQLGRRQVRDTHAARAFAAIAPARPRRCRCIIGTARMHLRRPHG